VGEPDVVDGNDLEGAVLDAAVAAVAVAAGIQDWDAVPGQGLAAGQQGGLIGLDHKQVVGLLASDQELGGVRMGVEGVGGDHRAGEVEPVQQRLERGDLLRRAADLALGRERRILIPTASLLNAVTTNATAPSGRPPRWIKGTSQYRPTRRGNPQATDQVRDSAPTPEARAWTIRQAAAKISAVLFQCLGEGGLNGRYRASADDSHQGIWRTRC
jgi:hypothetical protein